MLRKLSAFILLSVAGCATAAAQQPPAAPADKKVQRMALSAPFEASYLGVQTQEINRENV